MLPLLKNREGKDTFTSTNQTWYLFTYSLSKDGSTLNTTNILLLLCYCLGTFLVFCENFSASGRQERQVFTVISNSISHSGRAWTGLHLHVGVFSLLHYAVFDYRYHQKPHLKVLLVEG